MSSTVLKPQHFVLTFPRVVAGGASPDPASGPETLDAEEARTLVVEVEEMVQRLLNEARDEAERILAAARAEAEACVEKARAEAEAIRREAEKMGYAAGYQAGREALAGEEEKLRKEIAELRASLEEERRNLITEAEEEIIRLALAIATKVLHTELELAPEKIRSLAEAVIRRALGAGPVTLRVSSREYEQVLAVAERHRANGEALRVEVDPALPEGGLVAETPFGVVDGSIGKQLEEAAHLLLKVNEDGAAGEVLPAPGGS